MPETWFWSVPIEAHWRWLETRWSGNRHGGSNPSRSAKFSCTNFTVAMGMSL